MKGSLSIGVSSLPKFDHKIDSIQIDGKNIMKNIYLKIEGVFSRRDINCHTVLFLITVGFGLIRLHF